jgi:hypothetical protein
LELPVGDCNCQTLAEMLAAELTLQAADERRYLPAPATVSAA